MQRVRSWRWVALTVAATIPLSLSSLLADQHEPKEAKIARVERAAPPSVSAEATVVELDGTVLREGTNGWTCLPGVMPGDDHPMCNNAAWMKFMQAMRHQAPFQVDGIGVSYMLAGDARVNNADPFDTKEDPGEVWVQEGPHLMILVPQELLEGISDDPSSGGPYVMWKGTPYAHIMVPTAARDE